MIYEGNIFASLYDQARERRQEDERREDMEAERQFSIWEAMSTVNLIVCYQEMEGAIEQGSFSHEAWEDYIACWKEIKKRGIKV